jgi:hypothetical protein
MPIKKIISERKNIRLNKAQLNKLAEERVANRLKEKINPTEKERIFATQLAREILWAQNRVKKDSEKFLQLDRIHAGLVCFLNGKLTQKEKEHLFSHLEKKE